MDDKLISNFIRHRTVPVQWVSWWLEAPDSAAQDALREVLFEPGCESLRSLVEPSVMDALIRAVLETDSLRAFVAREVQQHLDEVAEEAFQLIQRAEE